MPLRLRGELKGLRFEVLRPADFEQASLCSGIAEIASGLASLPDVDAMPKCMVKACRPKPKVVILLRPSGCVEVVRLLVELVGLVRGIGLFRKPICD